MELHFATLFEAISDAFGDDSAVVHGSGPGAERCSWSDYDQVASSFAGFLAHRRVGVQARVALYLFNGPEYLIAQYGAFKHRAVPINVNYRYTGDELRHILTDSAAEVLVYDASLRERVEQVRSKFPNVRAWVEVGGPSAEPAWATSFSEAIAHAPAARLARDADDHYVLYTGGTTGLPKGVVFRMGDFVRRMFTGYGYRGWESPVDGYDMVAKALAHRAAGDRRVAIPACPLMHGTGLWLGVFYAHMMGGTAVTLTGRRFDAHELWRAAEAEGADAVIIVGDAFAGPMLAALDEAEAAGRPYRLEDMRIIMSSGVMWSAEVQRGLLRHLDVRLVDSMGSTESGIARRIMTRAVLEADPQALDTAKFELLAGSRVLREDGTDVTAGSGEQGRLAASGVCVPICYHNDPVKSAATFPELDGRRYVVAGDWATVEADGRIALLGRGSGCINTGGEKVFPEEVEEVLKTHPGVRDCLVVGMPDDRFGERVVAVVALSAPSMTSADDLLGHARAHLAGYKLPRAIRFVDHVERAANGKADYGWAKQEATKLGVPIGDRRRRP